MYVTVWPSGLRRQTQVLVEQSAGVRTPQLTLLFPFLLAGGLLVFVDTMKELPMTLLLRPFNFETLATETYQYAHSELMAEASVPALLIIASGLVPVFLMNKLMREI